MARAELGGNFMHAVLAWVDPAVDPTQGVEQVRLSFNINFVLNINTVNFEAKAFFVCSVRTATNGTDAGRLLISSIA